MLIGDNELLEMFEHILRLSRVDETQSVAILKSGNSNPRVVWAAMEAAQRLKAKVYGVELPCHNYVTYTSYDPTGYVGETALSGHEAAKKALAAADLIIDTMLLLHSPEQQELLNSGSRMLAVIEPPEVLARMLPNEDDKRRVLAGVKRLEQARTMTVQSRAGTDFRCEVGQYPSVGEYGFSDEPGHWDNWPSGFLFTWANEGTATGRIVIDTGDIILPFKRYAQSPITLDFEGGYIRKFSGGFDAEYLKTYMMTFNDPEVFALSHLGWGLQNRAQWTALGLYGKSESQAIDGRAFYGNFLFSTGPNTEAGGTRNTACHMDIPLRRCSIQLDDEPIVTDGNVIPADQAVPAYQPPFD
ncbi:2,5-dihydroxypyridine 5,6-dioxygenase [Sphingobium sp. H39-3-25]|uniref:2,5-dihydroxypyridine 5,6-dioxygenase n=1 Tax=Sphingobium arseniciresistens TaxID=3030834 RepID=UPI0023B9EA7B|nr:2,5-dihydroxypyridine 5,6-dioxygenase [Sphingobium arseniciresistens]